MRVIAGRAKGHRLKGGGTRLRGARPSSDLVRGVIFSVLASMGAELSRTLDLYAGSGALGIEALSRGGERCDFVEREAAACRLISENLRVTGFQEQAAVHCIPVERAPRRLSGPYTLVLADPPYEDTTARAALEAVASSRLVEPGKTVLVLEHSAREEPPPRLGALSLAGSRRHGDTAVSVYR